MKKQDQSLQLERGLPCNVDAERFVLGSILLEPTAFPSIAGSLAPDDFSLEKHRVIFNRMQQMVELGEVIDRMTLANELLRYKELDHVDGLSYLVSLDDGLPKIFNIASYASIVKNKSSLRRAILVAQHLINRCMIGEEPPNDILAGTSIELEKILSSTAPLPAKSTHEVVQDYPGGAKEFFQPPRGISTGFMRLDNLLYGLQPETIYVIGADTSVGKSSLAWNIAANVARRGTPVIYYSLEMSKESLVRRLASRSARIPLQSMLRNELSMMELDTLEKASEERLPLYVDDIASLTIHDFRTKTKRYMHEKGVKLAIVDYLQIMQFQGGTMPKFRDEREAISYATKLFKQSAKDLGIPIIEVSQLSRMRTLRSTKDLRPKLRDLHGSSTIEKDCDTCLLVYREEMDHPGRPENRGFAEVIVAKNRNGLLGTVNMKFSGELTEFYETDEQPIRAEEN